MNTTHTFIAKTLPEFEDICAKELIDIGAENVKPLKRAVEFSGNLQTLYKANYRLRTAIKILWLIKTATVKDEMSVYETVNSIPWETLFSENKTIAIDSVVLNADHFRSTVFLSQKAKDAVVDRFRTKTGVRPNVDLQNPDIKIHIHISSNICNVLLDSTGPSLHKRGYREIGGPAPLSEVLAAGLLIKSGWNTETPLFDPMCGTGTFLTEAALLATNTPPAKYRNNFCFKLWKNYSEKLFLNVVEEEDAKILNYKPTIFGSDIRIHSINSAKANIRAIGFSKIIQIKHQDFFQAPVPFNNGFIITNPPYGVKLIPDDLLDLYSQIGSTLKHKYTGYKAAILSGFPEGFHKIGLKPDKKMQVMNGPITCSFRIYSLFEGKRK